MSDLHARSFDAPRERPAPRVLTGRTLAGVTRTHEVERVTLVAVIKPHCDACHEFLWSNGEDLNDVDVVVVSGKGDDAWRDAPREVLVAPELVEELDARGAPWYLVIDPASSRVVAEGVLFSTAQVAAEIAPLLRR